MELKKTKVVMLPTNDVTDIIVPTQGVGKGVIHLKEYYGSAMLDMGDKYQHLYFTSDGDIKEGDFYIHTGISPNTGKYQTVNRLWQKDLEGFVDGMYSSDCKKIIATTDAKLTIETSATGYTENRSRTFYSTKSLPQIPQSFIKEYVKQGGIDEVELEYKEVNPKAMWNNQFRLKLTLNNEVVVHLIEEKMYSKSEVIDLINKHTFEFEGAKKTFNELNEWIEENL